MLLFWLGVLHGCGVLQKGAQKIEIFHDAGKIIGQDEVAAAEVVEQHIVQALADAAGAGELKKLVW